MKKIEKLTAEQIAKFPEYVSRWKAIGLSTEPADRPRAEAAIQLMYQQAGKSEPRIVWTQSPLGNALAMSAIKASVGASVWDSVWDSVWASVWASVGASVWDSVWASVGASVGDSVWASVGNSVGASVGNSVGASVYGQHDAAWLAFYRFFMDEVGMARETEKLAGLWELCQSAGWALPYENVCFVSERHNVCRLNEAGRIHSESGPAIAYPDGFKIFAWHGYVIPRSHTWIIEDKARISPDLIDAEPNAELRRVTLEIYGFERYIAARGATVISEDINHGQPRRLLSMKIGRDEVRVIDVRNGSLEPDGTRRRFFLGAARNPLTRQQVNTIHEAVALSYGIDPSAYVEEVRT